MHRGCHPDRGDLVGNNHLVGDIMELKEIHEVISKVLRENGVDPKRPPDNTFDPKRLPPSLRSGYAPSER